MTGLLVLGTYPAFFDLLMAQDAVRWPSCSRFVFGSLKTGRDTGAGVTWPGTHQVPPAIPFLLILWISGRKRVWPGFAASAHRHCPFRCAGWLEDTVQYPVIYDSEPVSRRRNRTRTHLNLRGLLIFFVGALPYPDPSTGC